MEQHPVPRQITTFEFKLIGFMTLRQFLYLLVFIPAGLVLWKIIPIPLLNIFIGILTGIGGIALAFMPINDRPLDVWLKNLLRRLTSPTQYVYRKHNDSLYFLQDLFFVSDPHKVMAHIESREKLAAYLSSRQSSNTQRQGSTNSKQVQSLLQQPMEKLRPAATPSQNFTPMPSARLPHNEVSPAPDRTVSLPKRPFLTGVVKNNRKIPLPGVLIYVKDNNGATTRLLKTNPHGVFATYSVLTPGEYTFEVKDPKGSYFFDTMKSRIDNTSLKPLEFYSKELL